MHPPFGRFLSERFVLNRTFTLILHILQVKEMSSVPISSAFVRRQINPVKPEKKMETTMSRENQNLQAIAQQRQPFYNLFITSYKDWRAVGKDVKTSA